MSEVRHELYPPIRYEVVWQSMEAKDCLQVQLSSFMGCGEADAGDEMGHFSDKVHDFLVSRDLSGEYCLYFGWVHAKPLGARFDVPVILLRRGERHTSTTLHRGHAVEDAVIMSGHVLGSLGVLGIYQDAVKVYNYELVQ